MEASRLTSWATLLSCMVFPIWTWETAGHRGPLELLVALGTLEHLWPRESCPCDRLMEPRTGAWSLGQGSCDSGSAFLALCLPQFSVRIQVMLCSVPLVDQRRFPRWNLFLVHQALRRFGSCNLFSLLWASGQFQTNSILLC